MFGINTAKRIATGLISSATGASGGSTAGVPGAMKRWGTSREGAPMRSLESGVKAFFEGRNITGSMMDGWNATKGKPGANQDADVPGMTALASDGVARGDEIADNMMGSLYATGKRNQQMAMQKQELSIITDVTEAIAKKGIEGSKFVKEN